jgi:hypothetical protein
MAAYAAISACFRAGLSLVARLTGIERINAHLHRLHICALHNHDLRRTPVGPSVMWPANRTGHQRLRQN